MSPVRPGDRIAAVAEQPRPGIDPYRLSIYDPAITCPDGFHDSGQGGTEPVEVGGGWLLRHCAREGCEATARVHNALINATKAN